MKIVRAFIRGKTERKSPLLHREMICHVIEAALLSWPNRSIKNQIMRWCVSPQQKKSFCPSQRTKECVHFRSFSA